jgi:predicted small lipoprotein YifL
MFKRLLLVIAMTAALAACGTTGNSGAPVDSIAPVSLEPSTAP